MENKFIPVYQYAKQNNTSKQNVYRWIRESKFDSDDVKIETIMVERMFIKEDATKNKP